LTVWVVPVAGAAATAPAAGVVAAPGVVAVAAVSPLGVVAAGVVAVVAALVSAAGCLSPPQAPRMAALVRSAIPWNRISEGLQ
jgi:hypothetical protein